MALPLLGLLGILKNVPKLFKAVKGGDGGLVGKALSIAKAVTGIDDDDSAVAAIKADPELAYSYEMALLADKHIPDRLNLENTQGARDMYANTDHEQTDKIAHSIMRFNLWIIFALVGANIGVVTFIKDGALVAIASNLIGIVVGHLLSERKDVVNFHFGSSMGSKNKDKIKT